jgi:hypothetical protein
MEIAHSVPTAYGPILAFEWFERLLQPFELLRGELGGNHKQLAVHKGLGV